MPNALAFLHGGSLRIAQKDVARLQTGQMPEQLFFEGVMARPEVNRNKDGFTPADLREIAATLAHTPIDDEHKQHVVQGSILSARYDDAVIDPETQRAGALIASGVTWPRRFPDIALGLLRGSIFFSIESGAETVSCSACGAVFATTDAESAYCACLQARHVTGSATARYWHTHRGIGAAFTTNPAGTNCATVDGSLLLVASYDQPHSPATLSGMLTASVFAAAETLAPAPSAPPAPQEAPRMTPQEIAALLATYVDAATKNAMPSDDDGDESDAGKTKKAMCSALKAVIAHEAGKTEAAVAAAKTDLEAAHTAAVATLTAASAQALLAEKRLSALAKLSRAIPDPEVFRPLAASLSDEQWTVTLGGYAQSEQLLAAAAAAPAPTPVAPTPAAGHLLASANTQTATAAPSVPTQAPAPGRAAPTSLADFTLTPAH